MKPVITTNASTKPATVSKADDAPRVMTPEAERALAEAAARRAAAAAAEQAKPAEIGGQPGPDPVRFGDWEKGGIASDF
jgi:hypothetical protein